MATGKEGHNQTQLTKAGINTRLKLKAAELLNAKLKSISVTQSKPELNHGIFLRQIDCLTVTVIAFAENPEILVCSAIKLTNITKPIQFSYFQEMCLPASDISNYLMIIQLI